MCRFLAYKGSPIVVDRLLYEPENSLIKQSYKAKEMEEPLNGDGFGVGWYTDGLGKEPGIFSSIRPAWNNKNLRSIAPTIQSKCLFAHVRAASVGAVTKQNCHPFQYKNFMMMHNGGIRGFQKIKRPIMNKLTDERYHWVDGQTDSQHIFALLIDNLLDGYNGSLQEIKPQKYVDAFCKTFKQIEDLKDRYGASDPSFLNLMITDGELVIGSRYVTDSRYKPRSLYHSEGARYECRNGKCRMNKDCPDQDKAVLIVSEKLNENENEWYEVSENHLLVVDNNLNTEFIAI